MMMHSEGYRSLTKKLMSVAYECCGGKLLMTHEGGYEGNSVPFFGLAVLEELSGIRTDVNDPFMDIFAGLAGGDVQTHQKHVIDAAALLVENIT